MIYKKPLRSMKIALNEKGVYDLVIDNETNGFISEEYSLSPVILSLLENIRQEQQNLDFPIEKRGGCYFQDVKRGSLLWIKKKMTQQDIQTVKIYIKLCLKWLIDEEYLDEININDVYFINNILKIQIDLINSSQKETVSIIL